ncbi:vanadium-dependent haloperoxidase [Falsiroseomonas sp. HW251]|uniref:vanadium-dependent haloperoxidase n=1 Tax=Falsiroseomonas sp. HW251 TaxID=3390998 RepID=UPI003D31F67C
MPSDLSPRLGRRGLMLLAAALGAAGATASTTRPEGACATTCGDLVTEWSLAARHALAAERIGPLAAGRILAIAHLAMHDAANAALPRFAPYAAGPRDPGADPSVAAAAAAHEALTTLLPGQAERFDALLAPLLDDAGPGAARARALGVAAAQAVLATREADGAETAVAYHPSGHVGAYRFTDAAPALEAPHWGQLRPFALRSAAAFRVPPPPAAESAAYARAFAEVKALGGRDSALRTEAQTRSAHFWAEPSIGAWNRIAREVVRDRAPDLWDAARLFALLNMALADAAIATRDSKRLHDAWRPETAIRLAGGDFNPATTADPDWRPLLPTPASQGHPSDQAAQAAAAALVLGRLLGEATPFAFRSATALPDEPERNFPSFAAAAQEAAESRILAGAQFRYGVDDGLDLGERVGRAVLRARLAPVQPRYGA